MEKISELISNICTKTADEISKDFNSAELLLLEIEDPSVLMNFYANVTKMGPGSFPNVKSAEEFAKIYFAKLSFSTFALVSLSRFATLQKDIVIHCLSAVDIALKLCNYSTNYHEDLCLICTSIIQLVQHNSIKPTREINVTELLTKYTEARLSLLFILDSLKVDKNTGANRSEEVMNAFYECIEDTINVLAKNHILKKVDQTKVVN